MLEDMRLPNYLERLGDEIYLYGVSDFLRTLFLEIKVKRHIFTFKKELDSKAEYIYDYLKGKHGISLWYLKKTLHVWARATGRSPEQLFDSVSDRVQAYGLRRVRARVKLPRTMTPDLAYLVGVIVGDGWIIPNGNLVGIVSGDEKHLRNTLAPLFRKLFDFNVCIRRDPRKNHTYFLETHSRVIVSFLTSVFGLEKGKKVKIIPTIFQNYPRNILMEFITGFFDTDGTIDRRARMIKFTQKSRKILAQIKEELANFHIRSSLYHEKRWDGWELRISNRDKKKFFTVVRPRLQKKKVLANTIICGPVV